MSERERDDERAGAPEAWVLYDGGCGVCRSWVTRWERTLGRRNIAIAPLQAPWVAERLGLPPEELLRDVRLLWADGRHVAGAEAYRAVMRRIWWARPVLILSRLPGLRRIFDGTYRRFADHRHRISRACRLPGAPDQQ